jgi:hypothetical protein
LHGKLGIVTFGGKEFNRKGIGVKGENFKRIYI